MSSWLDGELSVFHFRMVLRSGMTRYLTVPVCEYVGVNSLFRYVVTIRRRVRLHLLNFRRFRARRFIIRMRFRPISGGTRERARVRSSERRKELFHRFRSFIRAINAGILQDLRRMGSTFHKFRSIRLCA